MKQAVGIDEVLVIEDERGKLVFKVEFGYSASFIFNCHTCFYTVYCYLWQDNKGTLRQDLAVPDEVYRAKLLFWEKVLKPKVNNMGLADKQREARIEEKGEPRLKLDFDVFPDGSVSMWTHFNHGDDFQIVKQDLVAIQKHLTEFLKDENMCPFHKN